jgi:metal-sulfur cluster biosynthetic enzyme
MPDPEEIRTRLDSIKDPCSVVQSTPMGLDEMGLVKSVEVDEDGCVDIELRLTSPFCEMVAFMQQEAIKEVGAMDGVREVRVRHDSGFDWDHDLIKPPARQRRELRLHALRTTHG